MGGAVMTLFVLIAWFILSVVIAGAAKERGRGAFNWFLISIFFSPLIAGLFLLLFPPISSIDDEALQRSIRAADQLAEPARIEPTQFAPAHDHFVGGGRRIDRSTIVVERVAEPLPERRRFGSLIALIVVLLLATVAITVWLTDVREPKVAENGSQKATSAVPEANNNSPNEGAVSKVGDYPLVASWPCARYLKAYGTPDISPIIGPLIDAVSSRGDGLGSAINIVSFVATECRLHETITIGQAVENLFDQEKHDRLPRIPVGGATNEPYGREVWDVFDKWVHHKGPRPNFPPIERVTNLPTSAPKAGGQYCNAIMSYIEQHNQADRDFGSTLPPENRNSPKNSNYKAPYAWRVLTCDETNDPNRVGGMIDIGGGSPWFFEASKSAYPFPSGGDAVRLAGCLEAIARPDDILGVPACHSTGELRKICETTPRFYDCDRAPDRHGCARRNAVCQAELGH
jgi:hypothetical protein